MRLHTLSKRLALRAAVAAAPAEGFYLCLRAYLPKVARIWH